MALVFFDGSSTTGGLWGGSEMGYADRLKATFIAHPEEHNYAFSVNFAAPLRTAIDIARDLPGNIDRYTVKSLARVGIYMLGLSDSRAIDGKLAIAPRDFRTAVHTIGNISLDRGFKPIFLGPPPIDEARTSDFGREHAAYTTEARMEFDDIVRDYAAKQPGAEHIDLASQLNEMYPDTSEIIAHDGLHPNHLGHAAIRDIVLPVVIRSFRELKHPVREFAE